jgi:carbonic anhydrase
MCRHSSMEQERPCRSPPVRANVPAQAEALLQTSDIVRESSGHGYTLVLGARHDLESGLVTLVH